MFTHIAAFVGGVFVGPLVFLMSIGASEVLKAGKHALSEAQQLPQTPERVALIEEMKMRLEKLESLIHARTD